jgi:iron complex transport system substrate-binding protein
VYGTTAIAFPGRIVCLTAETAEIAYLVGAGDRIVGVPGTARRPDSVREKAKVGGFTTFRLDRILALEPDLVLGFSDLQKDVVRDLIGAGVAVLCTNQRSLDDVLRAILVIGGALGCEERARALVQDMTDEIRQIREYSSVWPDRPRVYFEEWPDPLIAGIRWASEAIEVAGGRDVFAELRNEPSATGRVVQSEEVVRRDPQVILASWCGKPVDQAAIAGRSGWQSISAVKRGQIHELDGADILSPGPSLLAGLRQIHEIIQGYQASV